jgi:hypothetical protein
MQKSLSTYLFLFCSLFFSSSDHKLRADPLASVGGIDFNVHEFGLNIQQSSNDYFFNQNIRKAQLVFGLLRTIAIPVEYTLNGNQTKKASATRALVAIIRMCEEICFIAGHPKADHTIDIAWTIADAATAIKETATCFKNATEASQATKKTSTYTDHQSAFDQARQEVLKKIAGRLGITASTLLEMSTSMLSAFCPNEPNGPKNDRELIFVLRSIMSFTRLLRSYLMAPKEDPDQRRLYTILMGLQACYTAFKLSATDFQPSRVFDADGYDQAGFDANGYNEKGFDQFGRHRNGTFKDDKGLDANGYNEKGFDQFGIHRNGTFRDDEGFDANGYNKKGFDQFGRHRNGTFKDDKGFDANGYNEKGFDQFGRHRNGTFKDDKGLDANGYNEKGFDQFGIHRNGTFRDDEGFDANGYNKKGFDQFDRHRNGTFRDDKGFDANGYNEKGFDQFGRHRNGTFRDDEGYDQSGYNRFGYDRRGCNRFGHSRSNAGRAGNGAGRGSTAQTSADSNAWKKGKIITEDTIRYTPSLAKERARMNLGVSSTATQEEARKAYLKLARELHPDKTSKLPPGERKAAVEAFKIASQANNILNPKPNTSTT